MLAYSAAYLHHPPLRNITDSRAAIVVVQHAAQATAPPGWPRGPNVPRLWKDQPISEPLVIALSVIMSDEVANGCPQGLLSKRIMRSRHDSLMVPTNLSV